MNKKSLKTALLAALAIVVFFPALSGRQALALDPNKAVTQYVQDEWHIKDGLPHNYVQTLIQTRDGYLWIGTQEGLARFDGVRFVVFDKKNTEEIRSNHIQNLYEGKDGSLWIGTNGGLTRLKDGKFTTYSTDNGLPNDIVKTVFEDSDGNLWLGTNTGLSRFKDGTFTTFTTKDGLAHNIVFSIYESSDKSLWIGTNGGLSRFKDGKFTTYTLNDGLSNLLIRSVCESRDGSLWIGTYGGGLNRLKDGEITVYSSKEGLSHDFVRVIYEDRDANLWIGTYGGGLNRYREGRFETYSVKEGLTSDFIYSIYEDREGSLWIGTENGGLIRLKDGKFTQYANKEGLSSDLALAIYEAKDGSLWIGTNGGGLNRLKDGKFTTYTTKDGLPNDRVRSICETKDGTLWIGTHGGGIAGFKEGKFTVYSTKEGLSNDFLRVIYESSNGEIWIGTENGLNRFSGGKFTVYTTNDGLPDNNIWTIIESRDRGIWIGTNDGLSKFKDGKFTTYTSAQGLPKNYVLSLYEDSQANLWIGTYGGGLIRFKNNSFSYYGTKEGLFDDVIFVIIEDNRANLWMSSSKGVFRIDKKQLNDFAKGKRQSIESIVYKEADGLKNGGCNGGFQPAGCKTKDGRLWFPTIKGVAAIDPENVKINRVPPPVLIEKIIINNKIIDPKSVINLPPGSQHFEIQYTCLSFLSPSRVKFKYKLEGVDKDWIDAGTRRTAFYTNIAPGNYKFSVMACNDDGIWNEKEVSLQINIIPRFYQTYLFYIFSAIAILLMAAGLYRLRIRNIMARERELTQIVNERTKELEQEIAGHKQTEEALAETNQALQAVIQASPLAITTLDSNSKVRSWNYAAEQIFGWCAQEVIGHPLQIVPEDKSEESLIIRENVLKGEGITSLETIRQRKDGSKIDISISTAPLRDARGNISGIMGVIADITQRKLAEEALRESEEKFRNLFENAPIGIYRTAPDGGILMANPALIQMLKYSSFEELASCNLENEEFNPGYPRGYFKETLDTEGEINGFESEWRRKDNSVIFVRENARIVRGKDGNILYYEGTVENITERKQAEMALQQSEEYFRSLIENSSDIITILNSDATIRYESPSIERVLGYRPAEIVGKNSFDFVHPDDIPLVLKNFNTVIEYPGTAVSLEFRFRHKDGSWRILDCVRRNALNSSVAGIIVNTRDITDKRQAEQSILESQTRLKLINSISNYMICGMPLEELIRHTINLLGEYFKGFRAFYFDFKEQDNLTINHCAEPEGIPTLQGISFDENVLSEYLNALRAGEPIIIEDILQDARFSPYAEKFNAVGIRALIDVPLIIFGRTAGVLCFDSSQPHKWSEHESSTIKEVAQYLSIAIKDNHTLSERKRAEEALRMSEERYRLLFESNPLPLWVFDLVTLKFLAVNDAAINYYGYSREEFLTMSIIDIRPPEEVPVLLQSLSRHDIGIKMAGLRKHRKKDGTIIDVEITTDELIFDERPAKLVLANDVTIQKQAEEQIKASLREKEVLLKEIHHRVKNNLQIISSLLNLQADYIKDSQALAIFKESQDRVRSMALIHEKLYQSKDLARVDFSEYIRSLAANLFRSYKANSDAIALEINVEDVSLGIDAAIPCGLIINELVSNSLKHAFPSGSQGRINIDLKLDREEKFTLVVGDDGVGFPEGFDFRNTESLGLQLVNALAEQLDGNIELSNGNGSQFRINFTVLNFRDRVKDDT
jgi:PAS domain S-box-containing protein